MHNLNAGKPTFRKKKLTIFISIQGFDFFERFTMTISLLRAPDVIWVTSPHYYTTVIFDRIVRS